MTRLSRPVRRAARASAATVTMLVALSTGCRSLDHSPSLDESTRLNLPSGIEPSKDAPKQYRSPKSFDPDYEKHPSRWRIKLRARYA